MHLLVGLGNPGRKYARTRHNVGFMVVDSVAERLETEVEKKKFSSLFGIAKLEKGDICIVKPQTFMNLSGEVVQSFAGYYKINPEKILIVQDDIDMPFSKLKFASKSGDGGHNGIADIIGRLGTNDFWRLKVGIGRPKENIDPSAHVLEKFEKGEAETVEKLIKVSSEAVLDFIKCGPESAMQKYNNTRIL